MTIYDTLVHAYFQVLSVFPPPLAWVVSLLVLVAFVAIFLALVRANLWFLILLVIFLPVVLPILVRLLTDLYLFFVFLLHQVGVKV